MLLLLAGRVRPDVRPASDAGWRGSGSVLVVDDDEAVREVATEILVRAGFSVLGAADGREAVEKFRRHAAEIRAVLLDRSMPVSGGREAFEALREIRPEVPILLVSGYSEERATAELSGRGLSGFVPKPFEPEVLLARLRAAIEP